VQKLEPPDTHHLDAAIGWVGLGCVDDARAELAAAPDGSSGWLHRAYALRRVSDGGLAQAWDALLPAAKKFPAEPIIAYNLSCYACQLQQLDIARHWLRRAVETSGKVDIKKMALTDPDLQALWPEIDEL